MSTLKNYHHGDLRAELIAAAGGLVRDFGPAGVSLRQAARAAGVSAMAPYRHFADKDALLAAVAAAGFERFAAELDAATRSAADARDGLVAQGVAYVGFACREPALFRLMFGPVITGTASAATLRAAGEAAYGVLERAVAAVRPKAGVQARADLTLAAWSIVHGLACLLVDGKLGDGKLGGPDGGAVPSATAAAMAARVVVLLEPLAGRARRN